MIAQLTHEQKCIIQYCENFRMSNFRKNQRNGKKCEYGMKWNTFIRTKGGGGGREETQ